MWFEFMRISSCTSSTKLVIPVLLTGSNLSLFFVVVGGSSCCCCWSINILYFSPAIQFKFLHTMLFSPNDFRWASSCYTVFILKHFVKYMSNVKFFTYMYNIINLFNYIYIINASSLSMPCHMVYHIFKIMNIVFLYNIYNIILLKRYTLYMALLNRTKVNVKVFTSTISAYLQIYIGWVSTTDIIFIK